MPPSSCSTQLEPPASSAESIAGNLLAAAAPSQNVAGGVFNLATGVATTLNQTVQSLRQLTPYQGPVTYAPDRLGDIKHSLADISKARRHLAYSPQTTFLEGLSKTVAWCRSSVAA